MSSKNQKIKAVVLAGGKGRRLAPYTQIIPKPLMPIGDKPILEILLRQMKRAGIRDVTLTVGYLADLLRLFFRDGKRLGMRISYVQENKPLGTSGNFKIHTGQNRNFHVCSLTGFTISSKNLSAILSHLISSGGSYRSCLL